MKNWRLVIIILVPLLAFADVSKTFDWTAPTQRTNGDALALTDIASYEIRCSTASGGPYNLYTSGAILANGQPSQSFTASNAFTEGTYYCVATDTDTNNLTSDNSNEINFTVGHCDVTDCRPMPPILNVGN